MKDIVSLSGGYILVGDDCSLTPWFRVGSGGLITPSGVADSRMAAVIVTELVRAEGRALKVRDSFAAKMCLQARNAITNILKQREYEARGLRCP